MIKFIRLEYTNFLGSKAAIGYDLKDVGLVFVVGPNGSCKSTIFEALVWCLWGKTARGMRYDEVVNDSAKSNCSVFCEFGLFGKETTYYLVRRYQKDENKGNSLSFYFRQENETEWKDITQGTMEATQKRINSVLAIDFDVFVRGPMMPQGSFKRLTQLTDTEIKDIFETALQFESLTQAGEKANKKLQELEMEHRKLGYDVERSSSILNQEMQKFIFYKEKIEQWYRILIKNYLKTAKEKQSFVEQVDKCWDDLCLPSTPALELHQRLERYKESISSNLAELNLELVEKTDLKQVLNGDLKILMSKISVIDKELDSVNNLQGKNCPVCKQRITKDVYLVFLAERKQQRKEMKDLLDKKYKEYDKLDKKVTSLRNQITDLTAGLGGYVEDLTNRYMDSLAQEKSFDLVLESLNKAESYLINSSDNFVSKKQEMDMLKDFQKNLELSRDLVAVEESRIAEYMSSMEVLKESIEDVRFWIRGFGNAGLKSTILSTVTPYLNQRAAYYSELLTEGQMSVEFSTQTLLKNGNLKDNFKINVKNTRGAKLFKGNSGGEQARANLVANLAFSDLMAARAKKAFPQRFYDEPFESIDETGIDSILRLLKRMSEECGSIFVTTHKDEFIAMADKVISLEKAL